MSLGKGTLFRKAVKYFSINGSRKLVEGYLVSTYICSQGPAFTKFELKDSENCGVSESPRSLIYHRYKVWADGLIIEAKITPPTAQNYAQMEADLAKLAPEVLFDRSHKEASLALEHLLRSYDPCISCSTHFLKLKHQRV